ncbi:MAG: recombinase XerD, partial [Nitrospirae bacterium]|nr:recombinase XerD [Nitrospirota bacterium]
MAKGIYKQKGSAYYWIRYAGLDGRVIRESTKTAKFKEAEAILLQRKRTVLEGKQP